MYAKIKNRLHTSLNAIHHGVKKNLIKPVTSILLTRTNRTARKIGLLSAAHFGYADLIQTAIQTNQINANLMNTNCLNTTPLITAAAQGHDSTVQLLLNAGATIHQWDNWGNTPLTSAAKNGHDLVVQTLINANANMTQMTFYPQNNILMNFQELIYITLYSIQTTPGMLKKALQSCLITAILQETLSLITPATPLTILVMGTNVILLTSIIYTISKNHLSITERLFNQPNHSALLLAIKRKDLNITMMLMHAMAAIDPTNTPIVRNNVLNMATDSGANDIAYRLLSSLSTQAAHQKITELTTRHSMPIVQLPGFFLSAYRVNSIFSELKRSVLQIQSGIFNTLWALTNAQPTALPTMIAASIVSKLSYPEWYQPRIQEDVRAMLNRVDELLTKRAQIAQVAQKPATTPIIFSQNKRPVGHLSINSDYKAQKLNR